MENPKTHIFSDAGRAALRSFVDRTTLFAFDLDGTLAPIAADPSRIAVPYDIHSLLLLLSRMASVAILTGRARSDALTHLGFNPGFVIGNHGAEGLPGSEEMEDGFVRLGREWESQLQLLLPNGRAAGVVIENKGATLSLHYRGAHNPESAQQTIINVVHQLIPIPRIVSGKYVVNLVPRDAPHKGEALVCIMHHLERPMALFIGDDETDEDVFRLGNDRILGIRVGLNVRSAARFSIRAQNEIAALLDKIILMLKLTALKHPS